MPVKSPRTESRLFHGYTGFRTQRSFAALPQRAGPQNRRFSAVYALFLSAFQALSAVVFFIHFRAGYIPVAFFRFSSKRCGRDWQGFILPRRRTVSILLAVPYAVKTLPASSSYLKYFFNFRATACISIGFAKWSFMPHAKHLWISSEKASAVIAIMGISASLRPNSRMALVAS